MSAPAKRTLSGSPKKLVAHLIIVLFPVQEKAAKALLAELVLTGLFICNAWYQSWQRMITVARIDCFLWFPPQNTLY